VWDLVFFGTREAPDVSPAYEYFRRGIPIAAGGLLMIEHPASHEYPEKIGVLNRWRTITNNDWTVTFYQRP
jgi:hypothetical protein